MGLRIWLSRVTSRGDGPHQDGHGTTVYGEEPLSGTTTVGSVEVANLIQRHGLPDRGMLDSVAVLRREPDNPVDPGAVAAYADGTRIGYLSSSVAQCLPLHPGAELRVPLRLFSLKQPRGYRGEAWVWFGPGPAQWSYSLSSPPPLTPEEKRAAEAAMRSDLVRKALAEGGPRAEEFRAGMVNGVHFIELIEPIKQLKREGRLREALALCYQAIEGAERSAGGLEPAPSYTEHAAIIHRKLGERDLEIAVLERWIDRTPPDRREGSKIAERLAKLQR